MQRKLCSVKEVKQECPLVAIDMPVDALEEEMAQLLGDLSGYV
jgi:hypothetical protein